MTEEKERLELNFVFDNVSRLHLQRRVTSIPRLAKPLANAN